MSIHESAELDDAVAYRIHRTNRLLLTHLSRLLQLSSNNLTPEKWLLLIRIYQRQPLRQVALTEAVLDDAPNVSRLVESLVKSGFVERSVDADDRRARTLEVTEAGAALCETSLQRAMQERSRVFDGFTESELSALTSLLDRLDTNVRDLLTSLPSGQR